MKVKLNFGVALLAVGMVVLPCQAIQQSRHQPGNTLQARQWDVTDITFEVDAIPEKPVDCEFTAVFEDGRGKRQDVAGFYNGGRDYVIRFTAPSAGAWHYVTRSTVRALDGLKGTLRVRTTRPGRKGGVVIDPAAPREFRYANGDTYYPIAFESDWLFALDAENATDIPLTRKLVDSLAGNGFNQVVMNVFAYDVTWKKDERLAPVYEYGRPRVFPFGGNNTQPNHSQLNIEYFKRLDRVINYLDEKGIAAHLMIYVWNKQVSWPDADSAADNRYFDYVVKRYQAFPNLIWDISKEALGYGHTDVHYISQRIDRLRRLDRYQRLVTVHDYGYCKRFSEKVDFISVQFWSSELYSRMQNAHSELPDQPILNIEHGGYEAGPYVVFPGCYTSPEVCLERAYQCVFAGTYPTHYWQCAAWNVIIPDIEAMAPETRPRLDYYRHMRHFVEKYNIGRFTAEQKHSNSGFCLHNGKDLYIYYVPKENISIGVNLPRNMRGKMMTGTWFNPFDGTFSDPLDQEITQWPGFKKPEGARFAILVVEIKLAAKN